MHTNFDAPSDEFIVMGNKQGMWEMDMFLVLKFLFLVHVLILNGNLPKKESFKKSEVNVFWPHMSGWIDLNSSFH